MKGKKKKNKGKNTIYKTLHRKLQIEHHVVQSGAPEGLALRIT